MLGYFFKRLKIDKKDSYFLNETMLADHLFDNFILKQ